MLDARHEDMPNLINSMWDYLSGCFICDSSVISLVNSFPLGTSTHVILVLCVPFYLYIAAPPLSGVTLGEK